MDIFEFQANKVVNIEGVIEAYKDDENDLGGIFMRLKNLMVSETHTKWDIAYLETYIKYSMVPRSHRWDVAPQKGETELEGWFKYFNQAGVSFLQFLVERKTMKLAKLDEEIKSIKDKLLPHKDSDEYRDKSQNLLKILEKEDKDQKIKKKKKYNRDLLDYHGNIVSDWQKNLLEEVAKQNNNEMEVTVQAANNSGGLPSAPPAVPYLNKRGVPYVKTQRNGVNDYSYQSPHRGNRGTRGGPPLRGQSRPTGPPRPPQPPSFDPR